MTLARPDRWTAGALRHLSGWTIDGRRPSPILIVGEELKDKDSLLSRLMLQLDPSAHGWLSWVTDHNHIEAERFTTSSREEWGPDGNDLFVSASGILPSNLAGCVLPEAVTCAALLTRPISELFAQRGLDASAVVSGMKAAIAQGRIVRGADRIVEYNVRDAGDGRNYTVVSPEVINQTILCGRSDGLEVLRGPDLSSQWFTLVNGGVRALSRPIEHPDGMFVIMASGSTVQCMELGQGAVGEGFDFGPDGPVARVEIAQPPWSVIALTSTGRLAVVDLRRGVVLSSRQFGKRAEPVYDIGGVEIHGLYPPLAMAIARDTNGRLVVLTGSARELVAWTVPALRRVTTWRLPKAVTRGSDAKPEFSGTIAASYDRDFVVAGGVGGTIVGVFNTTGRRWGSTSARKYLRTDGWDWITGTVVDEQRGELILVSNKYLYAVPLSRLQGGEDITLDRRIVLGCSQGFGTNADVTTFALCDGGDIHIAQRAPEVKVVVDTLDVAERTIRELLP